MVALAVMVAGLAGCADGDAAKGAGSPSTSSTSSGQATTAVMPVDKNVAPGSVTAKTPAMAASSVVAQNPGPSRGPEIDGSWYADPTDAGKPGSKLGPEDNVPAGVTASPPPDLGRRVP